jgi:hypothetical protein
MKPTLFILTSIISLALTAPVAHNEQDASTDVALPIDKSPQVEDGYSDSVDSWYITVQWYCFQDALVHSCPSLTHHILNLEASLIQHLSQWY